MVAKQQSWQLLDERVWSYMQMSDLSISPIKKIIGRHMFLKQKVDAAGVFLKLKARLVAGGDSQDKTLYHNISSPDCLLESVFGMVAIAAILRLKLLLELISNVTVY